MPDNLCLWHPYRNPGVQGTEVLKELRRESPSLVIIDPLQVWWPRGDEPKTARRIVKALRNFCDDGNTVVLVDRQAGIPRFDGSDHPLIAGSDIQLTQQQLTLSDQHQAAYDKLPVLFRFTDAQWALVKGAASAKRFLDRVQSLGLVERDGRLYRKVAPSIGASRRQNRTGRLPLPLLGRPGVIGNQPDG